MSLEDINRDLECLNSRVFNLASRIGEIEERLKFDCKKTAYILPPENKKHLCVKFICPFSATYLFSWYDYNKDFTHLTKNCYAGEEFIFPVDSTQQSMRIEQPD